MATTTAIGKQKGERERERERERRRGQADGCPYHCYYNFPCPLSSRSVCTLQLHWTLPCQKPQLHFTLSPQRSMPISKWRSQVQPPASCPMSDSRCPSCRCIRRRISCQSGPRPSPEGITLVFCFFTWVFSMCLYEWLASLTWGVFALFGVQCFCQWVLTIEVLELGFRFIPGRVVGISGFKYLIRLEVAGH